MYPLHDIKIKCCKSPTSIPIVIIIELSKAEGTINIEWGPATDLEICSAKGDPVHFTSTFSVCRFLARVASVSALYGSTILEKTEIDHWLEVSNRKYSAPEFDELIQKLNKALSSITYLVGDAVTLADICVWGTLFASKNFQTLLKDNKVPLNVRRWYLYLAGLDSFKKASKMFPGEEPDCSRQVSTDGKKAKIEDKGKFVDLPGAKMGQVVVRFPPEASGFLHIGHAKAALLNAHYQNSFQGKLIMRFDDTNPEKEKEDFEKVILEDVSMLEIKPDIFTYTSDHFEYILQKCEELLKNGLAFVDDTDPETMKSEREQRSESKNRANAASKNWKMWEEMKSGSEYGKKCCVRAKIDMNSDNGCLRDPTLYRCKAMPHPRTGTKYNVYPTYDFACPIVDSIENVTHALRTTEYHDRDDQFFWVLDALKLRKPHIYEYSRLNMTNTVLSKRKLTWFVDQGIVDGWDDPRMPTVRGVLRRGMTVEGLKQFIVAQGSSRSVVVMEWDKIWAFNKKVIDPIAPRYNAVEIETAIPVFVEGAKDEILKVAKHPKNSDLGMKAVHVGPNLLIDYNDAEAIKPGENVTFINWGNLLIVEVKRNASGRVEGINSKLNLENKDFKKTLKVTWVVNSKVMPLIPCSCVYFDHLISKPVLGKDEDFKTYLNQSTKVCVKMEGDPDLATVKKGDIIQIQRKGFFICDEPYDGSTLRYTSRECPLVLFSIPDGTKDVSSLPDAVKSFKTKNDNPKKNGPVEKSPKEPSLPKTTADNSIDKEIVDQGDKIRKLKLEKASKEVLAPEIEKLLSLKAEYKKIHNADWKPCDPITHLLDLQIKEQGEKIRKLKSEKVNKNVLSPEIDKLLNLKAEYKKTTNVEWSPSGSNDTVKQQAETVANAPASEENTGPLVSKQIEEQGDKIRKLKSEKASKDILNPEINKLLSLKAEYKKVTNTDWKPSNEPKLEKKKETLNNSKEKCQQEDQKGLSDALDAQIKEQGDKIRKLKSEKASKDILSPEVNKLLGLKAEYKKVTNTDWKPSDEPKHENKKETQNNVKEKAPEKSDQEEQKSSDVLDAQIKDQGDKIRKLKSEKASKDILNPEVNKLLSLKAEYKKITNTDWKPSDEPKHENKKQTPSNLKEKAQEKSEQEEQKSSDVLDAQIKDQGDLIRKLKSEKASKDILNPEVNKLLSLKAEYKKLTNTEWQPSNSANEKTPKDNSKAGNKKSNAKESKPSKEAKKEEAVIASQDTGVKKITRLGLEVKKEEDLAEWYSQVLTKAEMIEYYDVSGCYILRPWSYSIWEFIQSFFDTSIKKLGVTNCYFPMFVSSNALEKEKNHIEDFAPEVAWVTKSGATELEKPIAIRPTSETVMYPSYAKWIRSHRDLPLRLNQWCSVVRWEFSNPQPFIRTREFLWQEGHTAFATKEEAVEEVHTILDLYAQVYEDLLAIPIIKGRKTEKEKFAGADFTTTAEAYVSANGRGIQGATSHHLGQNFSKMFEIIFDDPETNEKQYAYQNSWGLSTRCIGAMVMIHGDNTGLVLPPRVAAHQVVIVPCGVTVSLSDADKETLMKRCKDFELQLSDAGVRVKGDYRDNYSPGWKFNYWELKGVPIRIEIGPKDLLKNQFVSVRRDTGKKITMSMDSATKSVTELLDEIHVNLYNIAKGNLEKNLCVSYDWNDFCNKLDERCIIQSPFCGEILCEATIKKNSAKSAEELVDPGAPSMGAKSLCIPFKQPAVLQGDAKCINPACDKKPQYFTLFGRSY